MPNLTFYIDLLARAAVRSPTSAAPAPIPDFRSPASYAVSLYFQRRADQITENYNYVRYSTGVPQLKLRRVKAPDYSTFTLDFLGYTSPVIDARLPSQNIAALIGSMASVGVGNVQVTGDYMQGFTVEFVGAQAGYAQESFTGRVISPAGGEIVIKQKVVGGGGINAVQTIQLRDAPLATATSWAEIGVPDTPGWFATLDTTAVPQDVFDRGDLALEVGLEASGVRTGSDGITLYESSARSGTDGQIVVGPTDSAVSVFPVVDTPTSRSFLVARDGNTVYGRLFTMSDIGRPVTETGGQFLIPAETVIADVINTEFYNAAVLSAPFLSLPPGETIPVDLGGVPTKIFKSATAAFVFADIGHSISGDNIPANTVIDSWTDAQTVMLSQPGTAAGTALAWNIAALPDNIFQSASAVFTPADIGARLESAVLPAGVYVTEYISATQVRLSARAISVNTGQAWTLKPKAGGFGGPVVSSTRTGTLSVREKQRIAFNQQPISGYVMIRDGADSSLPWVRVPAPLSSAGIEGAINAVYVNFLGVAVTELVPDGDYEIEWGINGQQHLLVVDQSNALFETLIAQIPVGQVSIPQDGSDTGDTAPAVAAFTHSLARRTVGGLYLLGVPATGKWSAVVTRQQITTLSDGTNGKQFRQRFAVTVTDYQTPTVGELGPNQQYRLDRHDNIEDRAGIRMYDWVGYKIPPSRSEYVQQSKPVMGVAQSILNGRVVDIQLFSYSFSTWVRADYRYMVGAPASGFPADGPWAILVHFTGVGGFSGMTALAPAGFAGTSGRSFTQSWTRRRWHADIFEQVAFIG